MIGRKYFCRKKTNTTCILGVCLILLSLWKFGLGNDVETDNDSDSESALFSNGYSRHLLTVLPNCTPRAIEQFPRDVFNMHQRRSGAVTLHIVAAVYMFLGFALLCDDYFVPSLEVLCDVLHIQSDVAGATFMAAGSSAPELATAIIAVFIAKDDIGVGTVVGSAVYNVMFVISVCALFAGMVIHLSWYPLVRDCIVYAISVLALAWVIHDEKVYWYEALVFLFMYCLYIVLMYFNTSLEIFFNKHLVCCNHRNQAMNGIPLAENGLVQREKNGNIKDAAFVSLVGIEEFDSDFEEEIDLHIGHQSAVQEQ
ncbi:NCKX3-like protein [Mya arenaria]|uniref:NCKX3-like protein n=1 Tax=Mya arenaria TaxID=6604 RepID=A0ABY7FQD3_MYAAR|nr:NCKX3-like protein [Mya arenaria]